jgi:hypothetical protein
MGRFLSRRLRNFVPWARDNILIAALMAMAPGIALDV